MLDWSARQLLGHVIDAQQQIAGMLTGHARPPVGDPAALGRLTEPAPGARWRHAYGLTAEVLAGISPNATVITPAGPSTAAAVLGLAVIEPLVHAWDLAVATGRPVTLDPDVVTAVLPAVLAAGNQLAATGMYDASVPIPPGATCQNRLLAALGRNPER